MSQITLVSVVRDILDCAKIRILQEDPAWSGRVCMNPYSVPTYDDCCGGQLQGTITRYYPYQTFPIDNDGLDPCHAGQLAADVTIGVYDCFQGVANRGGSRSCEDLDIATNKVTLQAAAVWSGVLCCLSELDIDWVFRSQAPIGNDQGGCIGSELTLTLGLMNGCQCD